MIHRLVERRKKKEKTGMILRLVERRKRKNGHDTQTGGEEKEKKRA